MEICKQDPQTHKFSPHSIEFFDTLGTGAFSRVRLVKIKEDEKPMAVKIFKKHSLIKRKQICQVRNEKFLLEFLSHPSIPRLEATFQDSRHVYFLMEYIQGGELYSRLSRLGVFPEEDSKFYLSELVLVLEYLHAQQVIFRDLKPENILIDKFGFLKLIDFGFAVQSNAGRHFTMCGTPAYLAPEIIMGKGYGQEVDWWALGVVLYEMVVGTLPFNDPSPHNIYQKIVLGRFSIPGTVNEGLGTLIRRLLEHDPEKRIGAQKIRDDQWLESIDFEAVKDRRVMPPWIPQLVSEDDTAYFSRYPDSREEAPIPVIHTRDPFEGF